MINYINLQYFLKIYKEFKMNYETDWKVYCKQLEERNEILEYQNKLFIKTTYMLCVIFIILYLIAEYI